MFDYTLVVVCGSSTTGLVFVEHSAFASAYAPTVSKTLYMVSGQTTEDITFSPWTTTVGCGIARYDVDTDTDAVVLTAPSVAIKAGCT